MTPPALYQDHINLSTSGRGAHEITHTIQTIVQKHPIESGLCHLFCCHTSCGLMINENADPSVLHDMEMWLSRLSPDGDPRYTHDMEGPDDMPAHLRTLLMQTDLTVPIQNHQLALGTWQGIYLYEHRLAAKQRNLIISLYAAHTIPKNSP